MSTDQIYKNFSQWLMYERSRFGGLKIYPLGAAVQRHSFIISKGGNAENRYSTDPNTNPFCGYHRPGLSQTLDEFIKPATIHNRAGQPDQAATPMVQALQQFPDNATADAYLGLYRTIQVGTTQNYAETGQLIQIAFEKLNQAVELDPNNAVARLQRGIRSLSGPTCLGKLDRGRHDLETRLHLEQLAPGGNKAGDVGHHLSISGPGLREERGLTPGSFGLANCNQAGPAIGHLDRG